MLETVMEESRAVVLKKSEVDCRVKTNFLALQRNFGLSQFRCKNSKNHISIEPFSESAIFSKWTFVEEMILVVLEKMESENGDKLMLKAVFAHIS